MKIVTNGFEISTKSKRETDEWLHHKDVRINGVYVGYYMSNGDEEGRKWVYVNENKSLKSFCSSTEKELLETFVSILKGEVVTLKFHFGIVEEFKLDKFVP